MTLATIDDDGVPFLLRRARRDDLSELVELLAADALRANDDSSAIERRGPYEVAFDAIDRDQAHTLVAVEDPAGAVVATMQLTLIPGLARAGATRMQVEAVRVAATARGHGLGTPKWDGDLGRPNLYMPLAAAVLERKVGLLLAHFATQRSKGWFDADTFRGLARLRGMECRAPERFAEAFTVRKARLA